MRRGLRGIIKFFSCINACVAKPEAYRCQTPDLVGFWMRINLAGPGAEGFAGRDVSALGSPFLLWRDKERRF